jgi:hypothetical protein
MDKRMNPQPGLLGVLREAIKAVPAVKFALGVAGVAAAFALVRGFISDMRVAFIGILVMFVLMFLLVIFSAFSKTAAKDLRIFILPVAWTFVGLTIVVPILLVASLFFGWPLPLKSYIPGGSIAPAASPTQTTTPTPIVQSAATPPTALPVTPTPATQAPIRPEPSPLRGQDQSTSVARRMPNYVGRARSLYAKGKYKEAINECDKALRINPNNGEAAALKRQIARTIEILNRQ